MIKNVNKIINGLMKLIQIYQNPKINKSKTTANKIIKI
jgi:hypothetical protein